MWRKKLKLSINSGFTLIEIMVATAIASLLSMALFFSFGVINDYVVVIDNYADQTVKESTLHAQLEKDLLGAFTPVAALASDQKTTTTLEMQPPTQTPEAKKIPKKKLDKVFYGTTKEGNSDMLTFITSNSLQVYWNKKVGKAKPRIARVVYRLVADKEEKKVFTLMRQEGNELEFDQYKPGSTKTIRDYAMIEGIKQFSLEYLQQEKNDKKNTKKTYKKLKEWKPTTANEKSKKEDRLIPDGVVIKGSLWDTQRKRDTPFEFKIMMNSHAQSPEESAPMSPQPPAQQQGQKQKTGPRTVDEMIAGFPLHLSGLFPLKQKNMPPDIKNGNQIKSTVH